jgi:23S rRNA pseudouridine1911/1915/1917 synthase
MNDTAKSPRTIRHVVSDEADEGERADVVLGRRVPALSRRQARNLAREGKLRIDGRRQPPSARVSAGQTLELALDEPESSAPPFELEALAITERFIYVHKPAGVHTVALTPDEPGVLATVVARRWPECATASEDPREGGAVHRLDRATSGVVAFARSRTSWTQAHAGFKMGRVAKHYLAVGEWAGERWPPELPADGLRGWIESASPLTEFADWLAPLVGENASQPERSGGGSRTAPRALAERAGREAAGVRIQFESVRIRAAIGRDGQKHSAVRLDGRRASTVVQPLVSHGKQWLVRLLLETGCRHQARVHLAWVGLPILGDPVYGTAPGDGVSMAIHLHAFAIDLSAVHPDEVPVFAPPPPEFWPRADARGSW